MSIDVKAEIQVCKQEESDRSPMDSWWQNIKEVCVPKDAYITRKTTPVPINDYERIYDTTIIESADGLANMMTGQLTPAGQQWMVWAPPFEFEGDEEVIEWYAECSYRALRLLHQSNFTVANSEVNIERATVGTSLMLCYETGNPYAPFKFRQYPVGTYTFQEDADGNVHTLRLKLKLTADQIVDQFPNAPIGPKVQNAYADPKKRWKDKFVVWHIIRPRRKRDPRYADNKNMPYAEYYICEEDEMLIEETGQEEFIGYVTRYQKGADGSPWGVSPARKAMPVTAQLNYLEEQLDILLDVKINPRILAEAGMVGEIDMRPGQRTITRAGALASPNGGVREWLTAGDYPLGEKRAMHKRDQIRKIFHHGMWADLARVEKEMTAEEVRQIRDQAETLFVGVNARFEADMSPLLSTRVFGICLRAGVFPEPPEQLVQAAEGGSYNIPDPQATYHSNLSRVMQKKVVENSDQFLTRLAQIAQFEPAVMDEFDLAMHSRELARAYGFKGPFIRDAQEVAEMMQKRLEAQQQQMQQEQGMAQAEAASNFAPGIQKMLLEQQGQV
jgi:hypothetical protein